MHIMKHEHLTGRKPNKIPKVLSEWFCVADCNWRRVGRESRSPMLIRSDNNG
jgi:hypothetical protein